MTGEWELIAWSEETTKSSSFTTAPTQIGAVTFDETAGGAYQIACDVRVSGGSHMDVIECSLYEDSFRGRMFTRDRGQGGPDQPFIVPLFCQYIAPSTGPKTFVVIAQRIYGVANCRRNASTRAPQRITVHRLALPVTL